MYGMGRMRDQQTASISLRRAVPERRSAMITVWLRTAVAILFLGVFAPLASADGGSAWGWGWNYDGQIGDGTNGQWQENRYRTTPVQVLGISGVRKVSAGVNFSVALLEDGTVWAWGDNVYGQLGDGTRVDHSVPVRVVGLDDVVAIASGDYHSLAVRSDGTVWAWGRNLYGAIGDGTTNNNRDIPVQVNGLTDAVAVAAGAMHSMALRSDGTVWAWGYNANGETGTNPNVFPPEPVQVPGRTDMVAIACGGFHSLALRGDGTLWAWGRNDKGQLGLDRSGSYPPYQVALPVPVVAMAAGRSHTVALDITGTVWAWGYNKYGQVGDGTYTDRSLPVSVTALSPAIRVAAGGYHSAAVLADRTVWCWGDNSQGQLGDGTFTDRSLPVKTRVLREVREITAGFHHCMAATEMTRAATRLATLDRSGIITEPIILRGYLYRMEDNTPIDGRSIAFRIAGTHVGSAVTDTNGRASLNWIISDGPATRTIEAEFAGDPFYLGSTAAATLTAQTVGTKMWGIDSAAMISDRALLRAYLWRRDNVGVSGKTISFLVDGVSAGTAKTNAVGRAQLLYPVPDASGYGPRQVVALWSGDVGYLSSMCANTLYVQRAIPYIWVLPRSVPSGGVAHLYAYFRRLFDYEPQAGKTVVFRVDGTVVQTVVTDSTGVARHEYVTSQPAGTYSIRCEFAGNVLLEPGYGEAILTIY